MKQVREGWVVFVFGEAITTTWPTQKMAFKFTKAANMNEDLRSSFGYTCRRVRVTIEELDQTEKVGE